jgi:hypothetical protein
MSNVIRAFECLLLVLSECGRRHLAVAPTLQRFYLVTLRIKLVVFPMVPATLVVVTLMVY